MNDQDKGIRLGLKLAKDFIHCSYVVPKPDDIHPASELEDDIDEIPF